MQKDLSKLSTEALLELRTTITNQVAQAHNMQMAKKIQLNSAYGALG